MGHYAWIPKWVTMRGFQNGSLCVDSKFLFQSDDFEYYTYKHSWSYVHIHVLTCRIVQKNFGIKVLLQPGDCEDYTHTHTQIYIHTHAHIYTCTYSMFRPAELSTILRDQGPFAATRLWRSSMACTSCVYVCMFPYVYVCRMYVLVCTHSQTTVKTIHSLHFLCVCMYVSIWVCMYVKWPFLVCMHIQVTVKIIRGWHLYVCFHVHMCVNVRVNVYTHPGDCQDHPQPATPACI